MLFCKNKFLKTVKFLSLNLKLINPTQKYSHIITSQAFILQIFVMIVAYEFSSLFFEMYWTQKLSNFVTWLPFTKLSSEFLLICAYQNLLHMSHQWACYETNHFFNKHHKVIAYFNIFFIWKLIRGWGALNILPCSKSFLCQL